MDCKLDLQSMLAPEAAVRERKEGQLFIGEGLVKESNCGWKNLDQANEACKFYI